MKTFQFNDARSKELVDKVQEVVGQLSLGDWLTLAQQLKNNITQKAEVHFASAAFYKMWALVEACSKEIAWDGIVYRDEENPHVFYVTDIIVYPQMVSGATVDTDDIPYLEWLNGLDDETFNHRRFNGHSHVNMGVTPSATDMTYREQSILNINDFFIFGVFNKRQEFNFQIYDVENNIIYDKDDIVFYTPEPDYSGWAKESMEQYVTEKKYTAPATTTTKPAATTNQSNQHTGSDWWKEKYGGKNYKNNDYDYYGWD